jgi:hypothetical protein
MTNTSYSTALHRCTISALFALLALWSSFATAATITAGQLVNIRVGNGTTSPASTGLPVTLDVYNVTYTSGAPTSVALAQSIALPTATSGTPPTSGDRYLTQGGTASGEGGLTLSLDGKFMALGGYNNIVAGVTNGTGNSGQRVVGLLNLSTGTVDTKTMYSDGLTTSAIRNAFTTNGTDIWTANSTNGVRYVTYNTATNTSTLLTASNGPERRVYIYPTSSGDQLYTSRQQTGTGGISGVATVGSPPPPTSGSPTVTELPGMPVATATESAYDYFFANANTLYVADDDSSPTLPGGLQKWIFDGSNWNRVYNLQVNPAGNVKGIKSLAGMVDASGNVTLFGATTDTTANYLYGFSDTLANTSAASVTANKLIEASTFFDLTNNKWNLRGVAIAPPVAEAPEPTAASLLVLGFSVCGAVVRRRQTRHVVGSR